MAVWESMITYLKSLGFYEFLLPWLLTFAIVYGLLYKANIFGGMNKKISGIIAFVVAFFVSLYSGPAIAGYFATLFTGGSLLLAVVIVGILFATLLTLGDASKLKGKSLWATLGIVVVLFLIAASRDFLKIGFSGDMWSAIIIIIIVIALAVWLVSGGEQESGKQKASEGGG